MPNTTEQIDAVVEARELLAMATPGPWKVYSDSRPDIVTLANVNSGYMGERHLLSMDKYGEAWGQDFENENDANLIARAPELLQTLIDEVEQRDRIIALAVRWRAERLRYQTDPTVTSRAYGEAADALAMEIEKYV